MSDVITIKCVVSGKVQGVWFRANTQKQAQRLGLTGYAKNLADGTVEVLATGERERVKELHTWLQQGPELARVDHVTCEEIMPQLFEGFNVL